MGLSAMCVLRVCQQACGSASVLVTADPVRLSWRDKCQPAILGAILLFWYCYTRLSQSLVEIHSYISSLPQPSTQKLLKKSMLFSSHVIANSCCSCCDVRRFLSYSLESPHMWPKIYQKQSKVYFLYFTSAFIWQYLQKKVLFVLKDILNSLLLTFRSHDTLSTFET